MYPYALRDNFLSPAEHNFYLVLKSAVSESALVCPKVALGDLFYARSNDPSEFRIYTNKIDRKHVDFLLCDPKTVKPLLGIELDDKSHQRSDRQARDEFIGEVFAAAKLPLVRMPVQASYSIAQLKSILQQHLSEPIAECIRFNSAVSDRRANNQPQMSQVWQRYGVENSQERGKSGRAILGLSELP